ncbi:Serine/Threonine-kinase ATM [Hirschfeldia incana]|nr:Serine/Threonine-kinase ATM [Hirschfeldia incana]
MKKLEKIIKESNPIVSDSQVPVTEVSMEEDDEGLAQGGGDDEMRKIDVSGGNISLVVDFSSSLITGTSSDNVFESNGNCLNVNENQTLVGNLVWAMNKSKRWWPGEVVGLKEESVMVRYLGQSQLVSWCEPSKLKPFKESFEEMVNQREDAGFFVAVEKAMTLLGNSLKLEMTCSCVGERNGGVVAKPLIVREFSVDGMETREFVSQLKNLAECVSSAGILELTVMQSRLSAFNSFSGHKQIPMDQLHGEAKTSFSAAKFVGSPSVVAASSRRRFRKEWFRRFVSEVDDASVKDDLANTSPSDLVSKLKMLAVDYKGSEEVENMSLFEWFFSKFRISVFHDENVYKMQLANMAGLMVDKDADPGTVQKTSKSKKLGNSKMKLLSGVSVADTEQKTFESEESNMETVNVVSTPDNEQKSLKPKKPAPKKTKHTIGHSDFSTSVANESFAKEPSLQSLHGEACSMADTLSRPAATFVPDLNSGDNPLASVQFDHLQEPESLIPPKVLPQKEERPKTMMLNFQEAAQCSNHGVSGTGFASSQQAWERNFTSADLFTNVTSSEKKRRGRKRKNPIFEHGTSGIPDLNGIAAEPASVLLQAEPTQRRRRRKKEELPNGLTRGITILLLKFSSKVSMPSRDDLTSTFSAFGPLDASETHVSEEFSGAQVAFVSSGDAMEAVKSLEKANPFGETLVSFRLEQKLISVQRNITQRMPVVSQVSPSPKLHDTPASVDSVKQNLLMMTAMLEKSGDRLSRETKAKLKSEVIGLLEKVSSMPSSSSSSD